VSTAQFGLKTKKSDLNFKSLSEDLLLQKNGIIGFFLPHYSNTPVLHNPLKLQETKSPLGITKAGSAEPGFLLTVSVDQRGAQLPLDASYLVLNRI
jgi:hypothetical protein